MARRSTEAIGVFKAEFGALIAERAYFKAEQRGFAPGHELEDWLAAEQGSRHRCAAQVAKPAAGAERRHRELK
jgi:hypothetical protein